ncbi:GtrA family protein [Verminephrobacter aporrectodeae]|uniref:GtrA family protein n=1 Tax=Verminephrobacter aporrectodeae subsp. tuberculatae TaxID=1110392 RepID=A0ABT3KU21_9BURK|nr:GtrA family protein [Verminephrobacter aporrectodeae]MCW5222811.1 GtrA family protein [Verminephrobacter aporrectodeae subsp. tuberculatae]MCW5256961.1 GtrA family protein [Verminephrobacter aporrectodeae subsp. tuberculatae]MCW5288275.1 GtrA family protein [Verminephrobacter aporrectodeae subsp. tuberculatae]MCW5321827.1 GtrA family protein [Verminephrobacter aporrectodeae subsp. tuberculatae]MCW8163408.1 GtrA family protein [Verminephrobacter aporrectodeae subsp. tuberculatae]
MASRGRALLARQAAGFAGVGAIGFAIDAGLFLALTTWCALAIVPARVLAFIPATMATWAINRAAVFQSPRGHHGDPAREYAKYLLVQGLGVGINFSVFYLAWKALPAIPALLPLALGSLAAMVFNFTGSRWIVFRSR